MTAKLAFTKMTGAGNDFVVIDNRDGKVPEAGRRERIARWCRRRVDIGADGALLVEPAQGPGADFRMRYYNADGGEAESCGNGARCISRFANMIGAAGTSLKFETLAGIYSAEVGEDEVLLSMSDPHSWRRGVALNVPGLFTGAIDYVNTGVPHVVIIVENLADAPVVKLGREIRYHAEFAPAGTNVNFIALREDGGIDIRTYERGVEDETLACGTGSVAAALVANLHGHGGSPMPVHTASGVVLTIHFDHAGGDNYGAIKLQGEARVVYQGVMEAS